MRRDYKILVIDDNKKRQSELMSVMDFLSEPAVSADSANWDKQLSDPDSLLAVVLAEDSQNDLLAKLIKWNPNVPVLMIGDSKNKNNDLTGKSVIGYLDEPFKHAQIQKELHNCQISQEYNLAVDNKGNNSSVILFQSMIGASDAMQNVRHLMEQVLNSDATVLILGESGTGKEVVARNLHFHSARKDKPFIAVNCGAIPPDLLESELFGHEKGSFTGAIAARKGRFELANGGTLFLDEIGDMLPEMQVKLLRVLQERKIERVGGVKSIAVDLRIISATHRDLEKEIENKNFREDLFYRLNLFPIRMPPLRARIDDLPLLISELFSRIVKQKRPVFEFSPAALDFISKYPWPGNIRELANLIERLSIMYPNKIVDVDDLPQKFFKDRERRRKERGIDLKLHLAEVEKEIIESALAKNGGDVDATAKFLNMSKSSLKDRIKKFDL